MDQYFEYSDRLNAPLEAFLHQTTPENFPILPHWHYFIEIIYLLEGHALISCDDHVYALHPNDLIYFPPQHLHTIDALKLEEKAFPVICQTIRQPIAGSCWRVPIPVLIWNMVPSTRFQSVPADRQISNTMY